MLLFRDLLGAYADAGQVLGFLLVFLQQVAARALDHRDFDVLALVALPVETAGLLRKHVRCAPHCRDRRSAHHALDDGSPLRIRQRITLDSHIRLLCACHCSMSRTAPAFARDMIMQAGSPAAEGPESRKEDERSC